MASTSPKSSNLSSLEKLTASARALINRLKDDEVMTESVIEETQTLQRKVKTMKQCVDDVNHLSEIARYRPRANLVKGLLQEDSKIRELQQENRELQSFLNEYQTALDIIMNKYREQVFRLMMSNKLDRSAQQRQTKSSAEGADALTKKQLEMVAVMQKAMSQDEENNASRQQLFEDLLAENKKLRYLLQLQCENSLPAETPVKKDCDTQT